MTNRDEETLIQEDIYAFLEQNQQKELLRFVTVGSVDDGKSTLIGRLLHDTKGVYDDQLQDAKLTSNTGETAIDFARITDGLRAEREQGITIDVAYRYFSTPVRKFIIADTPGHVQYTRNMATGASTAHVALILIDARLGVLTQSKRHATIASLLGIPHLLVCVNKMDLVDYDQQRYEDICASFRDFSSDLGFQGIEFLPVSALFGINIVDSAKHKMPWFQGNTVLSYLETVTISNVYNQAHFRLPVQYVLRPNLDYRGYAGQIASGSVKPGDPIIVMPSGVQTTVAAIDTYDGELDEAFAPMSITLRLTDEVDASRGDILLNPKHMPILSRHIELVVVWMSEDRLDPERDYWIKHGTQYIHVNIDSIPWKMNLDTLEKEENISHLELNDIACVRLMTHRPLTFDVYRNNRLMGSCIFIDFMSNNTVGAGMIQGTFEEDQERFQSHLDSQTRSEHLGQQGQIVWLTGSNATSTAYDVELQLVNQQRWAAVIEAHDPRYAPIQTASQAARIAKRLADVGLIVLCSVDGNDLQYALQDCSSHSLTVINVDSEEAATSLEALLTSM